jgi:transposase InsO family protein
MVRLLNSFEIIVTGADTIRYHLAQARDVVPAAMTIHRVLRRRGFVVAQPQKRPRSSWVRFESDLPNETWQSDMTHWQIEDDAGDEVGVEIVNFIDDYSRAVLCSAVLPVATAAEGCASSTAASSDSDCPSRS